MNCILSYTAVRWVVHMHADWLKKHLMLYMPSYAGGKVLYSAQFIRSVLLHSRDLYNIFHFPLTEGTRSHWLLNLNTVLQHGDALNLFIEKKKSSILLNLYFWGKLMRRGNIHYIRLTSQQWECHNDERDRGFKAGCLRGRYISRWSCLKTFFYWLGTQISCHYS